MVTPTEAEIWHRPKNLARIGSSYGFDVQWKRVLEILNKKPVTGKWTITRTATECRV